MTGKKVKITIDRLNIRMKGIASQDVRGDVNHVSSELLKQFAGNETLIKEKGMVRFESVNTETVRLQRRDKNNSQGIRGRIASGIASAVSSKLAHLNRKA